MNIRRILAGVGANLFSTGGAILTQALTVPVLVGCWGLSEFGAWLVLSTIPGYLAMANLGLSTVAGNEMGSLLARGETARAKQIYSTAWTMIGTVAVLLFIVGSVSVFLMPDRAFQMDGVRAPEDIRWAAIALLLYSVAILQTDALMAGYRATGRYASGAATMGVILIGERALVILVAMFGGHILAAAVAMAGARLIGSIYMYVHSHFYGAEIHPRIRLASMSEARRLVGPASGVMLFPLGLALNLQGPLLILSFYAQPAAIGIFGATRTLTRLGLQATNIVSTALMPEFTFAHASGDTKTQRHLFALNALSGSVLLGLMFLFFLLLGDWVFSIWLVEKGSPSRTLLVLLTLASVLNGLWLMIANMLLAANQQFGYTPVFVTTSIFMLASAALLVPAGGSEMMALLIVLAELAMTFQVCRQSQRRGIGDVRDVWPLAIAGAKAAYLAAMSGALIRGRLK